MNSRNTVSLEERLRQWAGGHGYGIAWAGAELVAEVQNRIAERHAAGELEEGFFAKALSGITGPLSGTSDRTVICVAVPRPAHLVTFATTSGPFTATAPPTYVQYGETMNAVQRDIEAMLRPSHVALARRVPMKSLAVRLGLAKYGRTNLTYTPQTGCLHELAVVTADVRLEPWPGLQDLETMLPQCATCDACRRACPTGAIAADRILIHAERCVTALNEFPGDDWPDWLPGHAHSALIGCMRCIEACPANRGKLRIDEFGTTFTVEETEAILSGRTTENEAAWKSVADKLAAADCSSWLDPLSRNLRAVMGLSSRR